LGVPGGHPGGRTSFGMDVVDWRERRFLPTLAVAWGRGLFWGPVAHKITSRRPYLRPSCGQIVILVVALWEAFYIEDKRFDLDTLILPNRSPTPISNSNDFPGQSDDSPGSPFPADVRGSRGPGRPSKYILLSPLKRPPNHGCRRKICKNRMREAIYRV
jgi:hypothetical protein